MSFRLLLIIALGELAWTGMSTRTMAGIPSGCDIPATYTMTNFYWFNSTHNLNCLEYQSYSDYYTAGCLDMNGAWCNPDDDGCDNCDIPYCGDDVPPQPLGYGPPDVVQADFNDGHKCESKNSAGSQSWDIGNGIVLCGGSRSFMQFFGDSTTTNATGRVAISPLPTKCQNGSMISPYYDVMFSMTCEHDAGDNATCRATQIEVKIPYASAYIQ